jgi:hypothetical protein
VNARAVAMVAADYAVAEFRSLESWLGHEEELAAAWLADPSFVTVAEYALARATERMRWNTGMQAYAAQRGGGPHWVAGAVIGEWIAGGTTVDRELDSW